MLGFQSRPCTKHGCTHSSVASLQMPGQLTWPALSRALVFSQGLGATPACPPSCGKSLSPPFSQGEAAASGIRDGAMAGDIADQVWGMAMQERSGPDWLE